MTTDDPYLDPLPDLSKYDAVRLHEDPRGDYVLAQTAAGVSLAALGRELGITRERVRQIRRRRARYLAARDKGLDTTPA